MATFQIEALTSWSAAKKVETKNGPRMLRTAPATQSFWTAWKGAKEMLKAAGVSCGKNRDGDWEACWWLPLDAETAKASEAAQAASRATDANVTLPCPDGLEYLPYQRAGIAFCLARPNVLIGDEMGLGKTIQAIGTFNADPSLKKTVVICPASLRLNWRREFEKWAVRPIRVAVINGGKDSDRPTLPWDVLIVNYDVLAKHRGWLDCFEIDLLISDESQYLKNPKAGRTKAVLGSVSKGKRTAEGIAARRKLFLTGTPIVNRPVELWPLVEALDPADMGRNFFAFAKRYCDAKETRWGWDFYGASRLDELQRKLREKFMVRRLKADVLTELPAKRHQVIEIASNGNADLAAKSAAIFDAFENLQGEAKSAAFEEMSLIRHEVGMAKVPHVIEHLEAVLEEGNPVVCFAHHKDVIAAIKNAFPQAVTLTGETSMTDRQAAVDAFQAGQTNLFIGNIQAAGVGITLTKSAHVVFAELDWVPGNLSQAADRCHRIGQTESVLIQYLALEGSMDLAMARKVASKQVVIDKALDAKPIAAEPQAPAAPKIESVEVPDAVIAAAKAEQLSTEQVAAIHRGLRILAGRCDGARNLDGAGFNRLDTDFGKDLAARSELTNRQAVCAQKLIRKYRGQLPQEILTVALGN